MTHVRGRGAFAALALALALSLPGCNEPKVTSAPPTLTPAAVADAKAKWPGITDDELAAGRALFVRRCKGCHGYPDLTVIDEGRWPSILARMAPRAGVSGKDLEILTHFVVAGRRAPVVPE
jgi:hypothetical protein